MTSSRLASLLALICVSALSTAAHAGSGYVPTVIPGLGPQADAQAAPQAYPQAPQAYVQASQAYAPAPQAASRRGRYGGGFIEFLMTGTTPAPGPRAEAGPMPMPRAASARAYVATTAPQDPDYGLEPAQGRPEPGYAPQAAPVPGYETPHKAVDPQYIRQEVPYDGQHPAGTVVIDTDAKFLYLVEGGGHALRYGIGVGRPGFLWHGEKTVSRKAEWPDWTPPSDMLKRRPDLPLHMEGGMANPLGARAMYLGSSLYRIHGTNEPDTIGTNVSSGCIRLTNDDVADLYSRVRVGTRVIVM